MRLRSVIALALIPSVAFAAPAPTKVTLADVGLEASSLDRTSDPCVDFYQFACGGWIAANQIPDDRARWSRGSVLDEKNKAALRALLEEDAKGIGTDAAGRKLGDYYASCMDEAAVEKAGLAPVHALLGKAQGVKDARTWIAAVTELHKVGVLVVWEDYAAADFKDSARNMIGLDAAGLGLPDRDYYLKPELKEKLDAYRAHVGRMLAFVVPPAKAEAAAADVLAIEAELAAVTKSAVEQRDVAAAYFPTDLGGLGKQVKSIDWRAYYKALGVTPSKRINVASPKFFAALDKLRAKYKPAAWASYFTYHLLVDFSYTLTKAIGDEGFALTKLLTGQEQRRERAKFCVDAASGALGELLGQQYVARYFPGTAKQAATVLVDALAASMADQIGKLDWMSTATKVTAVAKLGKLVRRVGYPDKWRTYEFAVKREDFGGNVVRAYQFDTHYKLAKAGTLVDRAEWTMYAPFTADAYYSSLQNNTAVPAGILQPPFFGQDRSVAANFGGIGSLVGHEFTHGFDDQGARFDGDGNWRDWWAKEDLAKFSAKASCVADQYSTFEALPKQFVQGRLTLGESIADLGGVKMAFAAYRAQRTDAPKVYEADGFTEDQQFFVGYAQSWCAKVRPTDVQRRLATDPHAPPKFRVYGALRNFSEFATAFHCAPGTPMRPANTCTVW